MITLGSRYQDEQIVTVRAADGNTRYAVFRTSQLDDETLGGYHIWRNSDRIDLLAERHLGSAEQWWRIMDYNPELLDPMGIPPGTVLRIPSA